MTEQQKIYYKLSDSAKKASNAFIELKKSIDKIKEK